MKVLIIEDDLDISSGLSTALKREGYYPEVAHNGLEGEELALMNSYGIILLDLMLPGKSGVEICKSIRQDGIKTPVLMLTARDQVEDRVSGLDTGADDYLVKPFALPELLARMRALGRREAAQKKQVHQVADLVVDTLAGTVRRGDRSIHLTAREYTLLEALIRNPGAVLTRDVILERVWNSDEALPNTVNFHMSSLRKKVDPEGNLIRTVHGLGYVLESR